MLTAKGQLEDIQCGHEVGAAEYFVKPFSPLALLEKINALLKNDSR